MSIILNVMHLQEKLQERLDDKNYFNHNQYFTSQLEGEFFFSLASLEPLNVNIMNINAKRF